jgi:hypothetical protein
MKSLNSEEAWMWQKRIYPIGGCFIFKLHFWIHWDTNEGTDFTDSYGFFGADAWF